MKRILLPIVALLLVASPAIGQSVVGSQHDLSAALPTSDRVCVFCHTPHQPEDFGGSQITTDPLWNHELSATASYGVYDSSTFDAGPGNLNTISDIGSGEEVSNLCMSCHDGTVGVGALYNDPNIAGGLEETPTNAATLIGSIGSGNADMGTDLSNDHPINFTYDAALVAADGDLNDPSVSPISDWLFAGTLQCASCHDVHDDTNLPFLRVTNANSALCTTCHNK
jgi:predicted CXXCH cytochrome family protein